MRRRTKINDLRRKFNLNPKQKTYLNVYYIQRLMYDGENISFLLPFADEEPFVRIVKHSAMFDKVFRETFNEYFRTNIDFREDIVIRLPCLTNYYKLNGKIDSCPLCEVDKEFWESFFTIGYRVDADNKMKKENLSVLIFDDMYLDMFLRSLETLKLEELVPVKLIFSNGNYDIRTFNEEYHERIIDKYLKDSVSLEEILITLTPFFFRKMLKQDFRNIALIEDFYRLLVAELNNIENEKDTIYKNEVKIGGESEHVNIDDMDEYLSFNDNKSDENVLDNKTDEEILIDNNSSDSSDGEEIVEGVENNEDEIFFDF